MHKDSGRGRTVVKGRQEWWLVKEMVCTVIWRVEDCGRNRGRG